jgi:hypothetical protein
LETARATSLPGPEAIAPVEGFALICAVYVPAGVPGGRVKLTLHDLDWFDEGAVNERALGLAETQAAEIGFGPVPATCMVAIPALFTHANRKDTVYLLLSTLYTQ